MSHRGISQISISRVLGDVPAFHAALVDELDGVGIDARGLPISHIGYKAKTLEEYQRLRRQLMPASSSYVEDVHNGRRIAKMILADPLQLAGEPAEMIELMPPKDPPAKRFGLEHIGFVLGDGFSSFLAAHQDAVTGQQDQGPHCQPIYIRFESGRRAKFYDVSLRRVLELEGQQFLRPDA